MKYAFLLLTFIYFNDKLAIDLYRPYCSIFSLLGQIIDSLDTLIDEWYPGLTCIDPLKGEGVLDIIVPCSRCSSGKAIPKKNFLFVM